MIGFLFSELSFFRSLNKVCVAVDTYVYSNIPFLCLKFYTNWLFKGQILTRLLIMRLRLERKIKLIRYHILLVFVVDKGITYNKCYYLAQLVINVFINDL